MRIAIVEDCLSDFELLQKNLEIYFHKRNNPIEIDHYENGKEFLDHYMFQYQIVFLDIEMPVLGGMDAARALRKIDENVLLVFLTNLTQYAIHGYEVNAIDYILKPISSASLELKLPKVEKLLDYKKDDYLSLISKGEVHKILISDIYYIEVETHTLTYYTTTDVYQVRGTISETEERLYPYCFRRCNNCYLVNLRFVTDITDYIAVVGPYELTISRPKKKQFINDFTQYLGGNL